jgi:hypothetical protein
MIDEAILELRVAFSDIPHQGLFFWLSLLLQEETQYESLIQKNFEKAAKDFDKNKELPDYYKNIIANLKHVREHVLSDPKARVQVEEVKDALIGQMADEMILEKMREDLIKQQS